MSASSTGRRWYKSASRAIAAEWEDVVNLTLRFVTSGTAEIRVSFAEQDVSWSTVGTDALTVPAPSRR